jgi:voltage-gated potassium channel
VRLARAKDRGAFLKWGWIDLVSSIPMLDASRAGRAVRIIRILRVLRCAGSARRIGAFLLRRRRAEASVYAAVLVSILLMVFATVAILELEAGREQANIHTPADAIWWAASTITSVGYGDRYPVTTEGRIIATCVMTMGIACFGTFTAFVASWFQAPQKQDADELARIRRQLDAILDTLESLRAERDDRAGSRAEMDAERAAHDVQPQVT